MSPVSSTPDASDGGRAASNLAQSLVDVAERLLREDGPHAVSLRRVAEAAGTTTQAVYTCFGGKPGLIDALYREGYARLAARLAEVDVGTEPLERIRALGAVYRERALADPHLYELMTAHPIAGYEPPIASRRAARATLQPLVDAAHDAVEAGVLTGEPTQIAHLLWAAGHGFVGLELHGLAPDRPDAAYRRMTDALLAGHRDRSGSHRQPPGDVSPQEEGGSRPGVEAPPPTSTSPTAMERDRATGRSR